MKDFHPFINGRYELSAIILLKMESPSSSRIYTCEFYNHDNNRVKHLYEIAFEILPREQGKSLEKDKHPILVHTINRKKILNGYALAFTLKWDYMGTALFSILLNRISYVAGSGDAQYWFPSGNRLTELVDGSIRVHTTDTKDMEIVFLTPLDTLPFMDTTGTFVYQYTMVSKMVTIQPKGESSKYKLEFPVLNRQVTLFQTGDKFRMMLDNTTMVKYKIEGCTTFREMPFNDILQ